MVPTDPLETLRPLSATVRYRAGAITFHWAMFVLVVIVGVLGLLHDKTQPAVVLRPADEVAEQIAVLPLGEPAGEATH